MTGIPERLERCAKVFAGPRDPAGKSELARRADIPLRTLNEYIHGRKLPLERAAAIAKAAGKSLMWLATGEGDELARDLPVRSMRHPPDGQPGLAEETADFVSGWHADSDLLRDVVKAIELGLQDRKMMLDADKKAEAVTWLYEQSILKKTVESRDVARVLRLVA